MGWAAQFSLPTVQIITMVLPIKITIRHPTHVITPLISTAWVTVLYIWYISIRGGHRCIEAPSSNDSTLHYHPRKNINKNHPSTTQVDHAP